MYLFFTYIQFLVPFFVRKQKDIGLGSNNWFFIQSLKVTGASKRIYFCLLESIIQGEKEGKLQ